MPLISKGGAAIIVTAFAASAMVASPAKVVLVEVWRGGDDGLTQGLALALERALKSSPYFVLSSGKKPGTLMVTIPTNVEWKRKFGRTKVLYTVKFTSVDNQNLGISSGSCWESALQKCADQIVNHAKAAAGRMH